MLELTFRVSAKEVMASAEALKSVRFTIYVQPSNLITWEQELPGNPVAQLFDRLVAVAPVDAALAEEQVNEFV